MTSRQHEMLARLHQHSVQAKAARHDLAARSQRSHSKHVNLRWLSRHRAQHKHELALT